MITLEILQSLVGNYEIVYTSLTGSILFVSQEERQHDIDILVVCKNYSKNAHKLVHNDGQVLYDIFVKDFEYLNKILNYELYAPALQTYNLFYNLAEPLVNTMNIRFDVEYHEVAYKETIRNRLKEMGFSDDFPVRFKANYKALVIPVVYMRFIQNGSYELTQQIKDEVRVLYLEGKPEIYDELEQFYSVELNRNQIVW